MNTNCFWVNGGGQQRVWKINTMAVQETVVDTGGSSSETETGGANMNIVPSDGGNRFTAHSVLSFANTSMANGTVPDDLIARGSAANQNSVKKLYDYGIGVGGRVVRDRLWFYSS